MERIPDLHVFQLQNSEPTRVQFMERHTKSRQSLGAVRVVPSRGPAPPTCLGYIENELGLLVFIKDSLQNFAA